MRSVLFRTPAQSEDKIVVKLTTLKWRILSKKNNNPTQIVVSLSSLICPWSGFSDNHASFSAKTSLRGNGFLLTTVLL